AELGQEDELKQLLVEPVASIDTELGSTLHQLVAIDATAVVNHGHDQMATGLSAAQPDLSLRGLASGAPPVGQLDAMIDGVADDVEEGLAQNVYDCLVDDGVTALDHERRLLAGREAEVAHEALEASEHER